MSAIIEAWIKRNYAQDVTFDLAPQLKSLIDDAIAQAVAAEREACAKIAERPELYGCNVAAFIRARSNGAGRK